jgi:hypothetical protein
MPTKNEEIRFYRFGAGQPEVLAERTKFYMLGI